jgi:hypothetical protein
MLTCKQVSNALAKQNYASMPPLKRAALKMHVALCVVCGSYNRHVMVMQDAARSFREHEENATSASGIPALNAQDKKAMKAALLLRPR